jgi:alkyl sulfatase BDS1-like metallo-beta-lactamase superfamily hydrolase
MTLQPCLRTVSMYLRMSSVLGTASRSLRPRANGACRDAPPLAPEGFLEPAIAENVYAGTAMARRAGYMYGAALPRGPRGGVGAGLGQTTSTGTVSLIVPTVDITHTGQELTVDGVRMVFQLAPGTEAPAEMHFLFPGRKALCMAENATHTLHNILTIRGAVVRDPHSWARYLSEAIELFGAQAEVVFTSHHWPTWGRERIVEFLGLQRDLYAYLHDQTLRLINQGYTGPEIAEQFELPPALQRAWHTHGYYGSVSHNVKAIYQRYLGWYDGNPARLWQHPPQEAAKRYVAFMGGADAVVDKARTSCKEGDLRWAAQVLDHVVFAEPDHQAGRALLADALEQLGFGSENGTWRSAYLSGAAELRSGNFGTPTATASADLLSQLPPSCSSTPSPSRSTDPSPGTSTSPPAGCSPTTMRPTAPRCATGCSATSATDPATSPSPSPSPEEHSAHSPPATSAQPAPRA